MSPSNYQDSDHVTKGVTMINGSRPSPLRIKKDSHSIHKQPSSSHHVIDQNTSHPTKNHGGGAAAKRQPVIIYTHSPKVIHAQARDFMALVQKLTGMSRAEEDERTTTTTTVKSESEDGSSLLSSDEANKNMNNVGCEETEPCSVMADEITKQQDCPPLYKLPNSNSYFDAPIFTPNSNDFFCSSTRANPISPSLMDIMKGFPEY